MISGEGLQIMAEKILNGKTTAGTLLLILTTLLYFVISSDMRAREEMSRYNAVGQVVLPAKVLDAVLDMRETSIDNQKAIILELKTISKQAMATAYLQEKTLDRLEHGLDNILKEAEKMETFRMLNP